MKAPHHIASNQAFAVIADTPPCRSRLAGEKPEPAAFIQAARVIVGDHRRGATIRQASSYKSRLAGENPEPAAFIQAPRP